MKFSDAMIKGYAKVGKQCEYALYRGKDSKKPDSVCALGAACLGMIGDADGDVWSLFSSQFDVEYGAQLAECNDKGMLIEDIVGMLQAIGE